MFPNQGIGSNNKNVQNPVFNPNVFPNSAPQVTQVQVSPSSGQSNVAGTSYQAAPSFGVTNTVTYEGKSNVQSAKFVQGPGQPVPGSGYTPAPNFGQGGGNAPAFNNNYGVQVPQFVQNQGQPNVTQYNSAPSFGAPNSNANIQKPKFVTPPPSFN